MDQDHIELYQEISVAKITRSFNFVLYALILIKNIFIILKIFWELKELRYIFIFTVIIDVILLLYPIFPLIFINNIVYKPQITKIFKLVSLILIILSLVLGLLINIPYWINLSKTTNFFSECPYNYNENSVNKLISSIEENKNKASKITKKCENRICFYISENQDNNFPYEFICNFNSENDFGLKTYNAYKRINSNNEEIYSNHLTECEKIDQNDYYDNNYFSKHFELCNTYFNDYYLCNRFEYPKKFNKNNFECPSKNYNIYLYVLGIASVILNFILAFIPWSLNYKSYSRIYNMVIEELNNENQNDQNEVIDRSNENRKRYDS